MDDPTRATSSPNDLGESSGKPITLGTTLQEHLCIISNGCGAGSTEVFFGTFRRAWRGGLLPFPVGSQDEIVDGGEDLPLTLECGIWTSLVGDADPAHVVTFVTLSQSIGRLVLVRIPSGYKRQAELGAGMLVRAPSCRSVGPLTFKRPRVLGRAVRAPSGVVEVKCVAHRGRGYFRA